MNKLDEIEATNNVLATGASRADVELLIRAVRQLGAQVDVLKHGDHDLYSDDVPALDPDVLELLGEP